MEIWRHHARNTLESSLDEAVWRDGTHWETSPSYHDGCVGWYGVPALLGNLRGEPFAPEYLRRLRAMADVIDGLQCPDGSTPPLSDSDRRPTGMQALAILRSMFPDLKSRRPLSPSYTSLWVSRGERWEPQSVAGARPRVVALPQGGYASATTSPSRRASHLILDNGPNDAGHAHWDNLAVYWEAFGRPALTDPGRYLYVTDDRRTWLVTLDRVSAADEHRWTCSWPLPAERPLAAAQGGWTASLASGTRLLFRF